MKKIGIFPFGGAGNPYTEMLEAGISSAGYDTARLQDAKLFPLRRAASSGVDALHLLWPGNLYSSSTRLGTWLKTAMFIDGLTCLRRIPAVYSADNLYSHDASDTQREIRMIQKIVNCVKGVTVASSAAEELFRKTYQLPEQAKIFCVPHRNYIGKYPDDISKAEARIKLGLPSSAPVVLSLGRITPYKGLPSLVSAFLEANISDAILLIAGLEKISGTVDGIKFIATSSGRPDSVRIHNRFIPDSQIQLYLRAADLMALSYEDVPMNPGSVILAMSFGLPVCCVAEGSVPEILGNALYGYSRSDKVGQVAALHEALFNLGALGDRGRIARQRAETNHSPEIVAEKLKAVYRYVLP